MGNLESFKGRGYHPELLKYKVVEETHISRQKDKHPSKTLCGLDNPKKAWGREGFLEEVSLRRRRRGLVGKGGTRESVSRGMEKGQ